MRAAAMATKSADVLLEQAGYVKLIGRGGTQHYGPAGQNAYYLQVTDTGAWSIQRNTAANVITTLRSGTVTALGTNRWHTLALGFSGSTITAKIDAVTVGTVTDAMWGAGQVGVGTGATETAQFDNLSITPGPATGPSNVLRSAASGRCLDVPAQSRTNGTQVVIWDCNGGVNQQWVL